MILEITGSQCSEIFWNYEDTTSVDKCWFGITRKETAEDSRTKYSERTKKMEQLKCDPLIEENLEMKSSFLNFLNSFMG